MKKCVVVVDRFGDVHAKQLEGGDVLAEAKALVETLGLADRPSEVFSYGIVTGTDDPGLARLQARSATACGSFFARDIQLRKGEST
jgi:hypothetical protein